MCYLVLLLLYLVYRNNGLLSIFMLAATALLFSMIPSELIQNFLLSLDSNEFLERFSSRLYLFLYDLESDNSVSYRQEIYHYFWNNPPLLYLGYGPKNFREFFGGHISGSLGFGNPHSFIIELYFGLRHRFSARLFELRYPLCRHHDRQPALRFQAAFYRLAGYGYLSDCRLYTINHFAATVYMVALLPDFSLYSMSSDTTPTRINKPMKSY